MPQPSQPGPNSTDDEIASEMVANRRLYDRFAADRPCRVIELDEVGTPGPEWTCHLIDLSRGGLGFRSRRMIYDGRKVFVEVAKPAGGTKLLFGVVRQSRYAEGHGYTIGVEFRDVPKTRAVQNWLAQRTSGR